MKISQKLVLGFLVVALLIWAVGYLATNSSQNALKKSIGKSSVSLAAKILDEMDRDIFNKIERFQSFADPSLHESLIKSNQEFEKFDNIQNYINEKDREWTSVPREQITPFMNDLINNKSSKELRKRTKFYEEKYGFRVYPEVFVTNKHGANAAQTGKTTDYRQDDEQWWQRAKEDGLYVADVAYDESADVYSTAIGIRIDDEAGNFLGVMKVVLSIEEVINIVKEAEAVIEYEHEEIHLVNKDGKIIYAKYHRPFEDISDKKYFKEITGNKAYFIAKSHHVGEVDALYCYARSKGYKDFKGLGWIILIEYNAEEIFAPIAKLRNNILIISLAVTISAILLGFFISKSISKPVTRLRDAVNTFAKGDLNARIDIRSNDEIGQLAVSFNDMAGKLKQSYADLKQSHQNLEEKVQQRTRELEGQTAQRSLAQGNLGKRIKETNCLYELSRLVERPKISLEQIFQETAGLIRNAYRYSDITCVRITFNGIHYKTDNFEKTELSQYAHINVRREKAGVVEVYYLGQRAEGGQNPFLEEERDLLDVVAKRLGRIAEQTQAREKLQLFRNLIDQSNDSVFVIDPQWGRFLDVNDKACDVLGYTREELLNMTVRDIDASIPDESSWKERANEILKEGNMVFESANKRKDGSTFPIEVNVQAIEQENKSYLLAVVRDISERKKSEEALRESETQHRTLISNIPGAVYRSACIPEKWTIFFLSDAIQEITGYPASDFIEDKVRTYASIIHPEDGKMVEKIVLDCVSKHEPYNLEYRVICADGSIRWIHDKGQGIFNKNGEVSWLDGVVFDITERKRAEQRQAELLKQSESVNKELKDFAYVISHDLKAPLRGIKTISDWILSDYADKFDEQGKEQMNLLMARVDRMHNLIDGVLAYSRVRRIKEEQVPVNLNELVTEVIDMLAPPENIEIIVENELPVVECEETRIMQVFQNLLSNAVKYMDKPKGQIKVGCVKEDGFWKFSVADNGPGIEEKHFEKIFQMFQTLSPRDELESTGVGLTVVKKIVELYGGKIWVESKIAEGSTFFFTLPKQEMGVKTLESVR